MHGGAAAAVASGRRGSAPALPDSPLSRGQKIVVASVLGAYGVLVLMTVLLIVNA